MSLVVSALRNAGLTPLVKGASRFFGYELWPVGQFPGSTLLGLRNFSIRTILDIGALDGCLAREMLMPACPNATVHSFEPSPRSFLLLQKTARQSGGKIFAHNFALGEASGQATYHAAVDAPASSSLLESTAECHNYFPQTTRTEAETVEVRTLDEVAPTLLPAIEDDLLIKMDVQGFEDRVIRGGRQTFSRARACIMEVQRATLYDGQPSFRDLFMAMDGLGHEYVGNFDQCHDAKGNVLYFDAVFIRRR